MAPTLLLLFSSLSSSLLLLETAQCSYSYSPTLIWGHPWIFFFSAKGGGG